MTAWPGREPYKSSTLMIKRVAAAIVEALQNDRDEDIRAGIGAIYGLGSEQRIAEFEHAIALAAIDALPRHDRI